MGVDEIFMPSGRTHDAITLILAAPTFALTYAATVNLPMSIAVAVSFIFGGFMFGPDLDTLSNQYARWGIFRLLWFPYRSVFKHRSRWSHGLIFGTLFRVIYCLGVLTIAAFLVLVAAASISGGEVPGVSAFTKAWKLIGEFMRGTFGVNVLPAVFVGMWVGAASHTFADMASTYVKTGRVTEFL
ncbi:MAG: metal-binding protein [Pyrinomonadaceae bacterium]